MFSQYDRCLCLAIAAFAILSGTGTSGAGRRPPGAFRENIDVDFSGKQQTTQEPPDANATERECQNYNLRIGISNIQYYSCCGGLKNKTLEYEPFYANLYCNPTRLRYGLLNVTSRFDCNGLEGQNNAKDRCSDRWGWVDEQLDCWVWSECFAGACEQEVIQLGSSAILDTSFCGDGRCDAHSEDSQNCAIDCCQVENAKCVAFNNTCPEACCAEPTCCVGADSSTAILVKKFWMIFLGIVAFLAIMILVVCCCFCYCCYSKCCKKKKQRRYSQMDVEMRSNSSPN